MIEFLCFVPKNLISYLFGLFSVVPIPTILREPFYGWYARRYRVSVEEAGRPLNDYSCLQDFFTRDLRPSVRPIADGLVSPVDGTIGQVGSLENGRLIQAKGKDYTIGELLYSEDLARRFLGGSYLTIYLAPGDYHHIHAPLSGMITTSLYVPGALWPVNPQSVEQVDKLFARNERIISVIEAGDSLVAVVKVGATNVGSVRTVYNDFRANPGAQLWGFRPSVVHQEYNPGLPIEKGERIGSFYLGSTVIVLLDASFESKSFPTGSIRYGQSLECESIVRQAAAEAVTSNG